MGNIRAEYGVGRWEGSIVEHGNALVVGIAR